jgi:hypothetical protein
VDDHPNHPLGESPITQWVIVDEFWVLSPIFSPPDFNQFYANLVFILSKLDQRIFNSDELFNFG